MKTSSRLFIVIAVLISMLSSLYVPAMADSDIVTFTDPTLEQAVRSNINKPTGDILRSDVSSIRALMLETDRVSSLSGIQALTSLGSLKITDSQLSDLTPLSGLPIYWVDFSNCKINSIAVMSGFSNLEFAYLKNNLISDVSPLMGLSKLAEVEFTGNPISEASVKGLPCASIKFVAPVAAQPTPEATATPTQTPVAIPSPTAIPIATPTVVPTPEPTPIVIPTVVPIATPTVVPTPEPTPIVIPTVVPVVTPLPTIVPIVTEIPVVPVVPTEIEQVTPAAIVVDESTVDVLKLSAVPDKSTITLNWNISKSKKLLGYNLYRNDGVDTIILTDFPVVSNTYTDTKVVPNVIYTYTVEAVYDKKNVSQKSKTIEARLTSESIISLQVDNASMKVNGIATTIDEQGSAPIVVEGRTLLPIRSIVEALGGTITWKGDKRLVTINFRGTAIELTIDDNTALVNGITKTLDVPATIKGGRTLVPLRFVGESLGCSIKWDPVTKGIIITY